MGVASVPTFVPCARLEALVLALRTICLKADKSSQNKGLQLCPKNTELWNAIFGTRGRRLAFSPHLSWTQQKPTGSGIRYPLRLPWIADMRDRFGPSVHRVARSWPSSAALFRDDQTSMLNRLISQMSPSAGFQVLVGLRNRSECRPFTFPRTTLAPVPLPIGSYRSARSRALLPRLQPGLRNPKSPFCAGSKVRKSSTRADQYLNPHRTSRRSSSLQLPIREAPQ